MNGSGYVSGYGSEYGAVRRILYGKVRSKLWQRRQCIQLCSCQQTPQWLIDSGCKTEKEVAKDSTSWGNYSDDTFSPDADGSVTGV